MKLFVFQNFYRRHSLLSNILLLTFALIVIYYILVHRFSSKCPQYCKVMGSKEWNSDGFRIFAIQTTWDGQCLCHDPVKISLGQSDSGDLLIKVDAPFFNSPAPPNGPAGQPFPQLWDYEVVEAFFLNDQDQYLEVELSPHGQHLLLLLNGRRKMVKDKLPIKFVANIKGDRWTGEAVIPRGYLPPSVTKFNAYAIHGEGDARQYEALYPVTQKVDGMQPDFHRLELFENLDMSDVLKTYQPSEVSNEWAPYIKS